MKFQPISITERHSKLDGKALDDWLRYYEPEDLLEVCKAEPLSYVNLINLKLVCPFEEFDFLDGSFVPQLQLRAYLQTDEEKIPSFTAIEQAFKFVIAFDDFESEPITDYLKARNALFKSALQLKPYWLTMKVITYSVVESLKQDPQGQHALYCRQIKNLIEYPSLSRASSDHYDVPLDQLKTEEDKKKHYLGFYKTLFLGGIEDLETQDVDTVLANCRTNEEVENLFNLIRPPFDELLNKEIDKIQQNFLGEARMTATEEEMNEWLQKLDKYIPEDRDQSQDFIELLKIEDQMIKDGVFKPSRITAEGQVEIDGKPRAVSPNVETDDRKWIN